MAHEEEGNVTGPAPQRSPSYIRRAPSDFDISPPNVSELPSFSNPKPMDRNPTLAPGNTLEREAGDSTSQRILDERIGAHGWMSFISN
mmetsp:Transcript_2870/g.5374  ORF Transcript_2870/g.5374 Transcript_2870/m.5374 type:complete len:88 (-) Transcript_2870:245-508(-)